MSRTRCPARDGGRTSSLSLSQGQLSDQCKHGAFKPLAVSGSETQCVCLVAAVARNAVLALVFGESLFRCWRKTRDHGFSTWNCERLKPTERLENCTAAVAALAALPTATFRHVRALSFRLRPLPIAPLLCVWPNAIFSHIRSSPRCTQDTPAIYTAASPNRQPETYWVKLKVPLYLLLPLGYTPLRVQSRRAKSRNYLN